MHGYRALLFMDNEDESLMLRALADGSIDGAIVTSSRLDSRLPASLIAHHVPVVLVNRYVDGLDIDSCVVDNVEGARQIAAHVLDLGHREIGIVAGPLSSSTARDRMRGFTAAFTAAGVVVPSSRVRHSAFTFERGRTEMASLIEADPRITAVLCGNNVLALGALEAAEAAGMLVPSQMTITGYDDMPIASWSRVDLTTVRQDVDGLGREGARLLIDRLQSDATRSRRVVLAPLLVERGTTARPRVNMINRTIDNASVCM